MRLRFSLPLLAAVMMTAMVGAAPAVSPVADAAMKGDRAAVRALIAQGADVNAAQGDGMSALHWAADRGDAELAEMLVYAGANPRAVTRIGQYTPLHLASRAGSLGVVQVLLKNGAEADAKTSVSGATPLHLAASAGNAAVINALLDAKADVNAKEAEWGQTPLIFAASLNRVEAIKALLARGADPSITSHALDLQKHMPLDRASNQRFAKVLENTAGKNATPSPSQLQAAVQASRELYASGKVPEPDPSERGRGGRGGGQQAATGDPGQGGQGQGGQQQFFEQTPGLTFKGGLTALLHASRQGHLGAATALLDGGANVNEVSAGDGTSPLLMATINGQFDMAMLLLERGADPNLAAKGSAATPLWTAINTQWQPRTRFPQPQETELQKATYLDVVARLLEKGADPNARIAQHPWYMVYSGCGNRNCGLADTSGSTAFWRAAYGTDVEAMKLLMKYGADPNIPSIAPKQAVRRGPEGGGPGSDGSGRTMSSVEIPKLAPIPWGGPGVSALHAAAGVEYGEGFAGNAHRHAPDSWLAAVKFLVEEAGLDVNARDNDGYTPLHHAAARGDNEVILYLVGKGADPTIVARNGQTVADMANGPVQRVSPFPATVALLEKLGSKNNHRCVSC
ncbi:MAG: ankyrin repeat domain-containing protein [Vicinamibacterales bacterium]